MRLTERFAALTPKQREQWGAIKDGAGLDAFLSEADLELTAEEKAQAASYIGSEKAALSDEELENVAGGGCADYEDDWKRRALEEGRGAKVEKYNIVSMKNEAGKCPICNQHRGSLFSTNCIDTTGRDGVTWGIYYKTKCYECDSLLGTTMIQRGSGSPRTVSIYKG